jgi:hypothetical protein
MRWPAYAQVSVGSAGEGETESDRGRIKQAGCHRSEMPANLGKTAIYAYI